MGCSEIPAAEVLGDDHDVVGVRLELQQDVLGEEACVDFASEFGEIFHDETLHFGHIHADERGGVARLEEVYPVVKFPV